mgnify:CR=1 FL=1
MKRQDTHKSKRIKKSWKKPVGRHSKQRLKLKSAPKMPEAGLRTPKEVRGLHPSGFEEVMVHRPEDLESVDNESEAARIGSSVGKRKRAMIVEKAEELDVKLLNAGDEE